MIKAKIIFSGRAYAKLAIVMSYFHNSEVAWHGIVHKTENSYYIEDLVVYPQTVGTANVDTEAQLAELAMWYNKFSPDELKHVRMQGHSHVNMPVFPSTTDRELYKELTSQIGDGFYVFMIHNRRCETWCAIVDDGRIIQNDEIFVQVEDGELADFIDSFSNVKVIQRKERWYGSH